MARNATGVVTGPEEPRNAPAGRLVCSRARSALRCRLWRAGVIVAFVAVSGSLARAADYPLPGTTLSISNNGRTSKFVWVSKDAAFAFPAAPPSVVGATLFVSAQDGDTATVSLGVGAWSLNKAGSVAKYVNKDAPGGDSLCRIARITAGKGLKVVCKSDLIDVLDAGPEGTIDVQLTVAADNYRASFQNATKDANGRLLSRGSPAPPPPGAGTCCNCGGGICMDISLTSGNPSYCEWFCPGGSIAPAGYVCDGVTGTCQPASSGVTQCCRTGSMCKEGPAVNFTDCNEVHGQFVTWGSCPMNCVAPWVPVWSGWREVPPGGAVTPVAPGAGGGHWIGGFTVAYTGFDGRVRYNSFYDPWPDPPGWTGWEVAVPSLVGDVPTDSPPAVDGKPSQNNPRDATIAIKASDGRLYMSEFTLGQPFTAWRFLSGTTDRSPAITRLSGQSTATILAKGIGGRRLFQTEYQLDLMTQSSWDEVPPGGATTDLAPASAGIAAFLSGIDWADIFRFHKGDDGRVYFQSDRAPTWTEVTRSVLSQWVTNVRGIAATSLPAINRGVYLFVTTGDNMIFANWYRTSPVPGEPAWRGWTPIAGLATDTAPAAATFNGCVILIAKGLDGHIYMNVMRDPYFLDFCGF